MRREIKNLIDDALKDYFKKYDEYDEINEHKGALDKSSEENRNFFVAYIVFALFLFVKVLSTTDLMLLKESSIDLPLLELNFKITYFYYVTPVLLLVFHFNILFNFAKHRKKFENYEKLLLAKGEKDEGQSMYPFLFNYLFLKEHKDNVSVAILKTATFLLLYILPLATFTLAQVKYSKYQDGAGTFIHVILFLCDLALLIYYWPKIMGDEEIRLIKDLKDNIIKIRTILRRRKSIECINKEKGYKQRIEKLKKNKKKLQHRFIFLKKVEVYFKIPEYFNVIITIFFFVISVVLIFKFLPDNSFLEVFFYSLIFIILIYVAYKILDLNTFYRAKIAVVIFRVLVTFMFLTGSAYNAILSWKVLTVTSNEIKVLRDGFFNCDKNLMPELLLPRLKIVNEEISLKEVNENLLYPIISAKCEQSNLRNSISKCSKSKDILENRKCIETLVNNTVDNSDCSERSLNDLKKKNSIGINLKGRTIKFAQFNDSKIVNAYFAGSNLSAVSLSKADLSYSDFEKFTLFKGLKLEETNLCSIKNVSEEFISFIDCFSQCNSGNKEDEKNCTDNFIKDMNGAILSESFIKKRLFEQNITTKGNKFSEFLNRNINEDKRGAPDFEKYKIICGYKTCSQN